MIYSLEGSVAEIHEDALIVEVAGVGYQVFVPAGLRDQAPLGETLKVFTYHHIREDQQLLFGFASVGDRQLFMLLTTVSGMGPKIAMKALSSMSAETLIQSIASGDTGMLTSLPGVGKKLAERLVIELKDKLPTSLSLTPSKGRALGAKVTPLIEDLSMALKSLGYSNEEIRRAISNTESLHEAHDVQSGIKMVLKALR